MTCKHRTTATGGWQTLATNALLLWILVAFNFFPIFCNSVKFHRNYHLMLMAYGSHVVCMSPFSQMKCLNATVLYEARVWG